jgi:hypothetical protein
MNARAVHAQRRALAALLAWALVSGASAQVPPGSSEIAAYNGLFTAAARGDAAEISRLASGGADLNIRDAYARAPLQLARQRGYPAMVALLEQAGAK